MVNIVTLTVYRITKEPLGMPMKDHLDWVEVGRCTQNVCSIRHFMGWGSRLQKKAKVQLSTGIHHSSLSDSRYNEVGCALKLLSPCLLLHGGLK